MAHLIDKDALVAEIKKRKSRVCGDDIYAEVKRGLYSSLEIYINTLEVEEVDLMLHTVIAEGCDWLALHTELSHEQIENCRNLMLTIKDEQLKAQKGK